MIRYIALVLALGGCLDKATVAPNADAATQLDASLPPDGDTTVLPPGVQQLASGNYLGFASRVANNHVYGVEYSGASPTAQAVRIVSIDATTGAVESFSTLGADIRAPSNLQASDTALFWLRPTDSGVALFRKSFATGSNVDVVVVPGLSNLPAGYRIDAYMIYPSQNTIFLLLVNGASYQLGQVPIGSSAGSGQYTELVSATFPGASSISFADTTTTFVRQGNSAYAGGRATGAGTTGGFVVKFDLQAKSVTVIQAATNDHMRSFLLTGARVLWIREGTIATTLNIANPLDPSTVGAVAAVPTTTFASILMGSKYYITSSPGPTTDLMSVQPGAAPANPPTGTTTMVASIPTCAGMTIAQCAPKISSLATDGTSLYFSATTAVYKYTAP